jgi:UDPglucose 6-dehydrogenase
MSVASKRVLSEALRWNASQAVQTMMEETDCFGPNMQKRIQITVVGSGYVGLVAAVCFAELGHQVVCVDNDEVRVAALRGGDTLIHEAYLPELLERYRNNLLRFETNLADAARHSEAVFIAVGTPQSDAGDADLSYVEAVAAELAHSLEHYTVITEKSTVPVYTNEWIRRVVELNGGARELFDVASNPEFLREGTAVADFLHPDRIVIGVDSPRAAEILRAIYAPLTSGEYYARKDAVAGCCSKASPPPILLTSTKAAEMIKHASNAFLAMKISFINAVSNLCEAVDTDVDEVARGIGMDERIGPRFLRPGIGYGGSCFPKDVAAFRSVAEQSGVDFNLLAEVEKINTAQKKRFLAKVRATLWTLRGKKLAVLGLAFKGGTDDIRESPAIDLIKLFLEEGCTVAAFDPAAMKRAEQMIPASKQMRYAASLFDAAQDADALLVLTDWAEFAAVDLEELKKKLRYAIVIDGRNMFEPETMARHGYTYLSMGRLPVDPQGKTAGKKA